MVTPAARREAVAHLRIAFEVSERRACFALGADRTSVRYRSTRPGDTAARARLASWPPHLIDGCTSYSGAKVSS
jgi:putative transposase